MSRVILYVIFGTEVAATALGLAALAGRLRSTLRPLARTHRLHRTLAHAALAAGNLDHTLHHTWTRADIHQLPACRSYTTRECDTALGRLTAAGALIRVGERDGQDLYRLHLAPIPDLTLDDAPDGRPTDAPTCYSPLLAAWKDWLAALETTWA
jgi:hypothetical protein